MAAGLLHRVGVSMGKPSEFYPPISPENARGFYENHRFRVLNDEILRLSGYETKIWAPLYRRPQHNLRDSALVRYFPGHKLVKGLVWQYARVYRATIELRMRRLLREYATEEKVWGWKDPRQMLTLAEWYGQLTRCNLADRVKIVMVYRQPLSVAKSLMARKSTRSLAHGIGLWYDYHRVALTDIDQLGIETSYYAFDDFLFKPTHVRERLGKFIGLDISSDVYAEFVSADLVRQKMNSAFELIERDKRVADMYLELQTRVEKCRVSS